MVNKQSVLLLFVPSLIDVERHFSQKELNFIVNAH